MASITIAGAPGFKASNLIDTFGLFKGFTRSGGMAVSERSINGAHVVFQLDLAVDIGNQELAQFGWGMRSQPESAGRDGGFQVATGARIYVNGVEALNVWGARITLNMLLAAAHGNDTFFLNSLMSGDDQIVMSDSDRVDRVNAFSGNDLVEGRGGDDILSGSDGNDVLIGGIGRDQLFGDGGDDLAIWNAGDERDVFVGGDGYDVWEARGSASFEGLSKYFNAANAVEEIRGAVVIGGAEIREEWDFSATNLNGARIEGRGGNDVIRGSQAGDVILGGQGDDYLGGQGGDDHLDGGIGADQIDGGDGNDVIIGGAKNDILIGGNGDDFFIWNAGDGRDYFNGSNGYDVIVSHAAKFEGLQTYFSAGAHGIEEIQGAVWIMGNIAADSFDFAGLNASGASVDLASGDDFFGGSAGRDVVYGNTGNDDLRGRDGNDHLEGGPGDDILRGGSGDDQLVAGVGNDVLVGGAGHDVLNGGLGVDVAYYRAAFSQVTLTRNPGGTYTVVGPDGTDQLLNMEFIRFEDYQVNLLDRSVAYLPIPADFIWS